MQSVNRHGTTPTQPQTDDTDTQNTVGKGADTNPYLALAATLAAVLAGLDHKSEPPQPYIGSAFHDPEAPPVPGSLQEALDALPNCPLPAQDLLTADVAAHYTTAARHELAVYRTTVTDLDRHRGLATA